MTEKIKTCPDCKEIECNCVCDEDDEYDYSFFDDVDDEWDFGEEWEDE